MHVVIALIALLLGVGYSVPMWGLRGKTIPVLSSILHFGGTAFSFLLGALTFVNSDWRTLIVASYPAVLITAGYLVQEVEDIEEDRLSGYRTTPVRLGRMPVFIFAAVLFGVSFWLLYWLTEAGFFPPFLKYTVALYPVYLVFAARASRLGLTRLSVSRLRDQYRLLSAFVVLAMLIGSLWKRGIWP